MYTNVHINVHRKHTQCKKTKCIYRFNIHDKKEYRAEQGPVPGGGTTELSDLGRPDTVLRVDDQSREVQTQTLSGFFCELRIPLRFSPCKTHSREMAKTSGFDPMLKVKIHFDCKLFDVANWVARLNGEDVPEKRLHMRPLQFHLKEH